MKNLIYFLTKRASGSKIIMSVLSVAIIGLFNFSIMALTVPDGGEGDVLGCKENIDISNNLVQNSGFEQDLQNWQNWGVNASIVTTDVHAGCKSVQVGGRTNTYSTIAQPIDPSQLVVGSTYKFQAAAKSLGGTQDLSVTIRITVDGAYHYYKPAATTVTDTEWVSLEGYFKIQPNENITEAVVYIENTDQNPLNFYLDSVGVSIVAEANWMNESNQRIQNIRTRDVNVTVLDAYGDPIQGVEVQVSQINNAFGFGTAVSADPLINNQTYQDFVTANFNSITPEYVMKWQATEPQRDQVDYSLMSNIIDYANANNKTVRGHTLIWGANNAAYVPDWAKQLSSVELEQEIYERLSELTTLFSGEFIQIDVINEMTHGNYFQDVLGEQFILDFHDRVNSSFPNSELVVNDYGILTERSEVQALTFAELVVDLSKKTNGAEAIGLQGHYPDEILISPANLDHRLTELYERTGKRIWITEFDVSNIDEAVRADNLEKFYRTAFANPYVDGITMWGFWAGQHWRGADAALVNQDWSTNKAGDRYLSLRGEWRTNLNLQTDAQGEVQFAGYHGDYELVITFPDASSTAKNVQITKGNGSQVVTIDTDYMNESAFSCNPDYDQSGVVDTADLSIFAQNYQIAGIDCALDLVHQDCYLGFSDFQLFEQEYKQPSMCS